jgi:hypothetical protein
MKKLRLRPDELTVESFEATKADGGRGTVHGADATWRKRASTRAGVPASTTRATFPGSAHDLTKPHPVRDEEESGAAEFIRGPALVHAHQSPMSCTSHSSDEQCGSSRSTTT